VKVACALLILASLCLSQVALASVQRFALVVGNNRGHGPDLELRYAESDAAKVAQVLKDLGGFQPSDVLLLQGEDASTVRASLIAFNDRIRSAQALPGQDALLFVYYSGHADAQALRLGSTRLELRELAQLVRGSAANARILVLDACRSGALTRLKGGKLSAPFELSAEARLPGEGMAFLTASTENEDAQESDEIRGSFFTNAFVSGLLGPADRDGDGLVVLEEAYLYARDATLRATSRTFAGPQHPSFQYQMRGQSSLVLTQPGIRHNNRGVLAFPKGIAFLVMLGDSAGPVVGELEPTAALPRLSLRPGRYFVRGRSADSLLEGQVEVTANSTRSVSADELTRVAYARLVRKGAGVRDLAHAFELGLALRGTLPTGATPCYGAAGGYQLSLASFSVGARLSACRSSYENEALSAATLEYAAALEVRHYWDYQVVSAFVGASLGAAFAHQSFETEGLAPARWATSPLGAFGIGAAFPIGARYFASVEALAELQLLNYQSDAFTDASLRWAFTPRGLLSVGCEL
jgi:hypothetical protein